MDTQADTYSSDDSSWWKVFAFGLAFTVFTMVAATAYMVGDLPASLGFGPATGCTTCFVTPEPGIYSQAQMEILGRQIASSYPDSKILLITDPETEHSGDRLAQMRRYLKKGLGSMGTIAASESPQPPTGDGTENSEELMMYEYYLTAAIFDKMLDDHPECDMVVSLMGLPYDFPEMAFWGQKKPERKNMFLVNANLHDLQKAIAADYIQGAVAHRPDIKYDINEVVPTDIQAAFDKRYLLITPDSVNDIATKYPKMFRPSQEDHPAPSKP